MTASGGPTASTEDPRCSHRNHCPGKGMEAGICLVLFFFFFCYGDFFFLIYLFHLFFNFFLLCWVFVAARGLSLVVASRGYSSLRYAGFSR